MSRIGIRPVKIPSGVNVDIQNSKVLVKGSKGELSLDIPKNITVEKNDDTIVVKATSDAKDVRQKWGLTRVLISNLITGVSQGFEKRLELQGVGYKYNIGNGKVTLNLGFSHPIELAFPKGVTLEDDKEVKGTLVVKGIDKEVVGAFASKIKSLKPVEPYKGKGFRYSGQRVIRKAGKASSK